MYLINSQRTGKEKQSDKTQTGQIANKYQPDRFKCNLMLNNTKCKWTKHRMQKAETVRLQNKTRLSCLVFSELHFNYKCNKSSKNREQRHHINSNLRKLEQLY
jgi:hypothetical protein